MEECKLKRALKVTSVALTAVLAVSAVSFCVYAEEEENRQVRIIVENNTFSVADGADWDGVLIDKWVEIDKDDSVQTILIDALSAEGYTQTGAENGYVTEIGGLAAYDDGGYMSGWMLALDDWITDEGMSAYTVESGKIENGDEISFRYTCDWGTDLGYYWDKSETNLSSLKFSTGKLTPEFSADVTEYTLTLPADVNTVKVTPTAENKTFRIKIYKNEYTPTQDGTDYKHSKEIDVADNDVLYIGVGNSAWHLYPPEGSVETVYKVNIVATQSEPSNDDEDKTKSQKVINLINSIGEVTLDGKEVIAVAREAYNSLTTEQKAFVTNYDVLVSAEDKYSLVEKTQTDFNEMLLKTTDTIMDTVSMEVGYEWNIMSLARADKISDASKMEYYNSVVDYINSIGSARLSNTKSTENSRIIIALSSLGYNAENINGYNLVEPLTDFDYISKQGINGIIYALIALDTKNYADDTTVREEMINAIIDAQLSDGGWTFWGDTADVDMTGIALQALAPYYGKNENVTIAVDKALSLLSENQNGDGTFTSYSVSDCESSAQVITALTAIGIDIVDDTRFIKNGNTILDGFKMFYIDGSFAHSINGEVNVLSTEQAYYALVSYSRYLDEKTSLYDMTDVKFVNNSSTVLYVEQNSSENSINSSSNTVNTGDNMNIIAVFAATLISSAGIVLAIKKKKSTDK